MRYLLYPVITFIVFLIIFYIGFIRTPRSRRFWTKTEYYVLAGVALSLISASGDIRKAYREIDVRQYEDSLSYTTPTRIGELIEREQELIRRGENECAEWFSETIDTLDETAGAPLDYAADVWISFYEENEEEATRYVERYNSSEIYNDGYCESSKGYTWFLIDWQVSGFKEWLEAKYSTEDNLLEGIGKLILPYIIAITLALEATKVTATLKMDEG